MATTQRQEPKEETDAERQQRAQEEEKAVRDEAEAATAHLPKPGTAGALHYATAADIAKEGEKMVRFLFAHGVTLTLPGYQMVHFPAGLQDVPAGIAEAYADELKANNAVPTR